MENLEQYWEQSFSPIGRKFTEIRPNYQDMGETDSMVAALYWLELEMYNGGFLQFFCNWGYDAYLTDADKVKSVYGACDNLLLNQLKIALKQELDSLNDYFSDSLNTDKDAYAALADIVNGEIRYPEIAFMYGYVYEKICNHYGTQIYCAENLWQLDSQSTFIPIPLSSDFPYIISIPVSELESKRTGARKKASRLS